MTPTKLTIYSTILSFIFFGSCSKPQLPKPSDIIPQLKKSAPARLQPATEEEVTFYPTYGYKKDGAWHMHLRGWVHENREHVNRFLTKIGEVKDKCAGAELTNFQFRSDDFEDDDKSHETVIVKFDSDPQDQAFTFPRSESVGIVEMDLVLPDDRAKQLLDKQGSANGWLTFRAVSGDHTGLGRVRLIEADGVSVVSDIDDTIKVTDIPAGQNIVLRNTFCRDFQAAPDMARMYSDFGDVAFHYVSGGPEQMFGPLYDFLIAGSGGFPEGTFHLRFFPKNLLSEVTRRNLKQLVGSSLDGTFEHKTKEIAALMDRFPKRQFILVGDSGEVDPEVYREIMRTRGPQVKEVWIRDVLNDADPNANPHRLEGMKVIKTTPPSCVDGKHLDNLAAKLKEIFPDKDYKRNPSPPCN